MKKISYLIVAFVLTSATLFAQDEYFFAGKGKLNPSIPTPESFFGFRIGTALVRYDKVVEYFKLLASKSDRASLQVFGKTWEEREQVKLFVTSPENQHNLEKIRVEHLKLVDPEANADISNQKIIVELGYNVHGGEIAGTDASVVAAYYLVASEDPEIIKQLDQAVVLIEPSENPDGRERAANYINGFHSWPPVSDPADREHNTGVTPFRGNHFWTDLNRDWLALSQIESQNRVAFYHKWYPNVYLDYHEMGSGNTYYFEPSPKSSWSNIIPVSNYEVLNDILAKKFSAALNSVGSLYYTKEGFTNYSPIYGSTYPDYQGGVGTTLEVGSTSGVSLETAAGIRTFSKNVRDNFLTSIAALRAATEKIPVFLNYQKDFFKSALTQADKLETKSIVFGNKKDKSLNSLFINHLLQHHINVYELTAQFTQDGKTFEPGSAYVVPLHQPQFRILQSIFEENETNGFTTKTTFYDASAPSTVHGYGIQFAKVKSLVKGGELVTEAPQIKSLVSERSELAYAFEYFDYLTPKALYFLEDNGVKVRVAQQPFTSKINSGNKSFARGTIVIPVAYQTISSDKIFSLLNDAAKLANINIYALNDGFSIEGVDLGSSSIKVLKKPVVAIIGNNWSSIGETWSLLGNTYNIPLVKIDAEVAEKADLAKYTSIILSNGQLTPKLGEKIKAWTENGGTLIALNGASQWASTLISTTSVGSQRRGGRSSVDSTAVVTPATERRSRDEPGRLNGIIVKAELNLSNQLTYGFTSKDFYTLKNSTTGLNQIAPNNVVLKINEGVLVNGYATPEVLSELKNKVVIGTGNVGSGSVLLFNESPTFRNYWLAPGRILTNALFFGAGGGRGRFDDYSESEESEN